MRLLNQWKAVLLLLGCSLLNACGGGAGSTSNAATDPDDAVVAGLLAAPITETQAVRFLWKSSFGPTTESIARLRQLGYARFVDEQLALSAGRYNDYMLKQFKYSSQDVVDAYCNAFSPTEYGLCLHWIVHSDRAPSIVFLKAAAQEPDQLRLRMAWALSQILVVSSNFSERNNAAMRLYQQMLRDHALGNYQDLLLKVSKNPLMGNWLDLAGSQSPNPNQNYARELLQLFSMGTYQRKPDGTFITNSLGTRLENYNQQDILAFSRALTGWTYKSSVSGQSSQLPDYENELIPVFLKHDEGSKRLLNGVIIPAGKLAAEELELVVNNAFSHPSTAPNIVRQLIQFMVTSNPSPAYVARVVRVWNNNGLGVAGDLKAVARAILLDAEALNPPDLGGRLLEPVLAVTGLMRAVGGSTDGAALDVAVAAMQQRPFTAPSVFNFYAPDYILPTPGPRRHAPQFGIVSMATVAARVQSARTLIYADAIAPDTNYVPSAIRTGTSLTWPASWKSLATNQVPTLVDTLNVRLAGGALDAAQRSQIVSRVSALPNNGGDASNLQRVRLAAFMVFSSPQFMGHR